MSLPIIVNFRQRESQEIEEDLAPALMRLSVDPVDESPLGVLQTDLGGQQVRILSLT